MPERILEILAEAAADAREAELWYEEHSAQAGANFVVQLKKGIKNVMEAPFRWPKHKYGTGRYRLDKFPYLIVSPRAFGPDKGHGIPTLAASRIILEASTDRVSYSTTIVPFILGCRWHE